jgi:peptidoglycan hydrolase CwlO-like protein
MPRHLTKNVAEIVILQKNLKDLQGQLANAQKKILELTQDKNTATEELAKERQLLLELEKDFSKSEKEASDKIAKQIEDWPDVLDSKPKASKKPEKSFKPPKVPAGTFYLAKEGEKWTRIKEDGTIEYMDIQPGEWED